MTDQRPDPDALLAKVQREEAKARRGRLKVFFGAAAGVGKTYAMLSRALRKSAPRGSTSSSASSRPMAAPTPRRCFARPRGPAAAHRRVPRHELTRIRSRRGARSAARAHHRRRARAHQRAGLAPSQALERRRGAARRGHRRLHRGQRPASGKPQRRGRRHHRQSRLPRPCPTPCSTRPTRSSWSTCRPTSCSSACSEGKVYLPQQAERRSRISSARAI